MTEKKNILALTFLQVRPEKAADILEQMDLQAVAQFFQGVPYTIAGPVASFMLPQYVARILTFLDTDSAASLLSAMNSRRAAGTLRYTDKTLRKTLIGRLPAKTAALLGLFLDYAEDTVGAWMIPEIMLLPGDCTAGEALERLRNTDQRTHGGMVYVVNREAQVQGSLHVSTLLRQNPGMPVSAIAEEETATLAARATLASVADHHGWRARNTLPVVNREKKLVGVLRHSDLHQGLKQISGSIREPEGSDAVTGLWEVYGNVLLSLFDTAGGIGTYGKNRNTGPQS